MPRLSWPEMPPTAVSKTATRGSTPRFPAPANTATYRRCGTSAYTAASARVPPWTAWDRLSRTRFASVVHQARERREPGVRPAARSVQDLAGWRRSGRRRVARVGIIRNRERDEGTTRRLPLVPSERQRARYSGARSATKAAARRHRPDVHAARLPARDAPRRRRDGAAARAGRRARRRGPGQHGAGGAESAMSCLTLVSVAVPAAGSNVQTRGSATVSVSESWQP
jgi:hypothetical protein